MKKKIIKMFKSSTSILLCFLMLTTVYGCSGNVKDTTDNAINQIKNTTSSFIGNAGEWFSDIGNTAKELYGTAKDGVIYVYDETAEFAKTGYDAASKKANELIGNTKDFIADLKTEDKPKDIKHAEINIDNMVRDPFSDQPLNESDFTTIDSKYATEQFVNYYISSVLGARGFDIYNGAVYYKGSIYSGLIFTNNDVFIEEDGKKIYSCGFVQLIDKNYKGLKITDNMVQTGLIAVSTESYGNNVKSFIVDQFATFDSFSGIYNNYYFSYKQESNYVLNIEIKDNKKSNYDSTIELYDFDNEKEIYSKKEADETFAAITQLYLEDKENFNGAASAVNSIVDISENTGEEIATVITLDADAIDSFLSKAKTSINEITDCVNKTIKGISLKDNQFLNFDKDGNAHVLGSENKVDEARLTNGIIQTVSSGLATAGAVASVVVVLKGGELVVSAIVVTTGACSIVYNVSNMLEGSQDIYYGAKGDKDESQNPVLNVFKKYIEDEKTAELVYNVWGIANTAISGLSITASKALKLAKVKGLNVYKTTVSVIRASLTTIGKALATGVGAGIVSNYVNKVVTKISNNENIGKLAGFGSALVSGFFIYRGLDVLDQKLDISGLYPKISVKTAFAKASENQASVLRKSDLTKDQRGEIKQIVNNLADEACEWYGIEDKPTIKIIYDPANESVGYYTHSNNTMTVNISNMSDQNKNIYYEEIIKTVGHELCHCQQFINGDETVRYNLEYSYYSPPKNYTQEEYELYANQPCEAEAFAAEDLFFDHIMTALS